MISNLKKFLPLLKKINKIIIAIYENREELEKYAHDIADVYVAVAKAAKQRQRKNV